MNESLKVYTNKPNILSLNNMEHTIPKLTNTKLMNKKTIANNLPFSLICLFLLCVGEARFLINIKVIFLVSIQRHSAPHFEIPNFYFEFQYVLIIKKSNGLLFSIIFLSIFPGFIAFLICLTCLPPYILFRCLQKFSLQFVDELLCWLCFQFLPNSISFYVVFLCYPHYSYYLFNFIL